MTAVLAALNGSYRLVSRNKGFVIFANILQRVTPVNKFLDKRTQQVFVNTTKYYFFGFQKITDHGGGQKGEAISRDLTVWK